MAEKLATDILFDCILATSSADFHPVPLTGGQGKDDWVMDLIIANKVEYCIQFLLE